jgi:hypothetical protein
METDLQKKLEDQDQKLEAIYKSVEKMRKYFLWTMIITIAVIVLPLIGLAFAIPSFMANYVAPLSNINSLGQ